MVDLFAQFPPAANQIGSDAIHKDSAVFVGWATEVSIERGQQNLGDDSTQVASVGELSFALGPADNQTISLGDGGIATLAFDPPLQNGIGADFAVFENGFPTLGGYFLELAFVEVSSDGSFFVRFPSISLTDTTQQLGTFDLITPTQINNLAGKHISNFGTPFDLEELKNIPALDINSISHIKIIDVVGSLADSLASLDSRGIKINDPFPTPFPSGGFDLDAVGVIHQQKSTSISTAMPSKQLKIYPNPVSTNQSLFIELETITNKIHSLQIFSADGRLLVNNSLNSRSFTIPSLPPSLYFLKIDTEEFSLVREILVTE